MSDNLYFNPLQLAPPKFIKKCGFFLHPQFLGNMLYAFSMETLYLQEKKLQSQPGV
jgi:hypothetical protein